MELYNSMNTRYLYYLLNVIRLPYRVIYINLVR
nr:MAG TPA: hypothetical protein [Caudoviricetes sp.]